MGINGGMRVQEQGRLVGDVNVSTEIELGSERKSEMFLSSECVRASRISLLPNPTRKVSVWCTLALRAVETGIACCGEAAGCQAGNLHSQMVFEWRARIIERVGRDGVGLRRAVQGTSESNVSSLFLLFR